MFAISPSPKNKSSSVALALTLAIMPKPYKENTKTKISRHYRKNIVRKMGWMIINLLIFNNSAKPVSWQEKWMVLHLQKITQMFRFLRAYRKKYKQLMKTSKSIRNRLINQHSRKNSLRNIMTTISKITFQTRKTKPKLKYKTMY